MNGFLWGWRVFVCVVGVFFLFCGAVLGQALQVGDRVPEEALNVAFPVVGYERDSIRLAELGEGLIVLDFWASWCAPCIASLRKLEGLQAEFGGRVKVVASTFQDSASVAAFRRERGIGLPSMYESGGIKRWFPYSGLPHQVWIYGGKVVAIPDVAYATGENFSAVLSGRDLRVIDHPYVAVDAARPLFFGGNGGEGENVLYSSVLSGKMGLPSRSGGAPMRERGNKLFFLNYPVYRLLMESRRHLLDDERRVVWELDSGLVDMLTGRGLESGTGVYDRDKLFEDWLEGHTFCYNLYADFKMARADCYEVMYREVSRFAAWRYGVVMRVEKRRVPCLVIRKVGDVSGLLSKGGELSADYEGEGGYRVVNMPASSALGQMLKRVDQEVWLVDSSGLQGRIDLELPRGIDGDVGFASEVLRPYGLGLFREELLLDMFVFSPLKEEEF